MQQANTPTSTLARRRPQLSPRVGLLLLSTFGLAGCFSCSDESGSPEESIKPVGSSEPPSATCPSFSEAIGAGSITNENIDEASGLMMSRKQQGVLWVHNDSGDSARFFAIDAAGQSLGNFHIENVDALDWEDMAIGPGPSPEQDYLYFADIGDNPGNRPFISVVRVPEPSLPASREFVARSVTGAEVFELEYPDGAQNAEAFMVDPSTGDWVVLTKALLSTKIYTISAPSAAASRATLSYQGEVPSLSWGLLTAADISVDGSQILLRSYASVYLYPRPQGTPLAEALAQTPCELPKPSERQGETIAWSPDSKSYFTLSEGRGQTLFRFDLRE